MLSIVKLLVHGVCKSSLLFDAAFDHSNIAIGIVRQLVGSFMITSASLGCCSAMCNGHRHGSEQWSKIRNIAFCTSRAY